MTPTNAIIQGAIQGLTEFLPVSSSGHLSLFQYFTGQSGASGLQFSIFLHFGTLLAVLLAFYKYIIGLAVELFGFVRDIFLSRFKPAKLKEIFGGMSPMRRMILLLLVSLLPMAFTPLFLSYVELVSGDNDIIVEGVCFLFTSILLFLSDNCIKGYKTAEDMSWFNAAGVGAAQMIAPFPGVSRSGATISVGLLAGLDREFAVAFSFLMGIPPVLGANLMELRDAGVAQEAAVPTNMILLGTAVALVVGLLAIFMVKWLVKTERFRIFAWYTMVLGVLTIGIGIFERLTGHMIQELVASFLPYLAV